MLKNIEEVNKLCAEVFLSWCFEEETNPKMEYKDKDKEFLEESFIAKVLLKKFETFNIKIHLPVHLLMLLSLCAKENPGQTQIILKDLLLDIKSKKGPIFEGYVISSNDFANCFEKFPVMEIPEINDKYHKLWDDQKYVDMATGLECNACDIIEWWKEVMQ